ncbi:MAG: BRO-N domain-containing protein [Candidatus Heimdallarchaeaceae archaeon]
MSIVAYENIAGSNLQVIEENGEYWFIANQIAQAVGHIDYRKSVYNLLNRNPDDFKDLYLHRQIVYAGQKREVILLNEEGIYLFCMLSKTEKATQFRRAVSKFLKRFRTNRLALVDTELARLVKNDAKRDDDVSFINSEIKLLHDHVSLLASEVKRLQIFEEKELNARISFDQFYHLKDEGWKLIRRIAMLKGKAEATADEKRDFWKVLKRGINLYEYFKTEKFSVKQYNSAMKWLEEQNKKLDLKLEGFL